jgi:hypothetical protein
MGNLPSARTKLLAPAIMGAAIATLGGHAIADSYVTYTLSGAEFGDFYDGSGAETLSGTWTVDYTTDTVTALALNATGPQNFSFTDIGNVYSQPGFTGTPGVDVQYEIGVTADIGYPYYLFLDYQASNPISMLVYSDNYNSSHLHELGLDGYSDVYSPLTSPGTLSVPEPATWALFTIGFGALGLAIRSSRRREASVPATA